jgi:hypothetical protein
MTPIWACRSVYNRCRARFGSRNNSNQVWHINDQPVNDLPYNPFGGEKNSGVAALMESGPSQHSLMTDHDKRSIRRVVILSMRKTLGNLI